MKKIGEVAKIQIGYHPRERIVPGPECQYRIVQMKDIDDMGHLNLPSLSPIRIDGNPEKYLLWTGDVLFQSKGQRNLAFHISDPLANVIASGIFFILRVTDAKVLPGYLAWYINQPTVQSGIKDIAQGSQIPMIPRNYFANIEIEIPPLQTQKAIIELDKLARKEREILQGLSNKHHELIQAFCHQKAKEASK